MYIHIKVKTNCKKEEIRKKDESNFEIDVKEKAERNEANKRIVEILKILYPKAKQIKIVNGHHSPSKLISVNME